METAFSAFRELFFLRPLQGRSPVFYWEIVRPGFQVSSGFFGVLQVNAFGAVRFCSMNLDRIGCCRGWPEGWLDRPSARIFFSRAGSRENPVFCGRSCDSGGQFVMISEWFSQSDGGFWRETSGTEGALVRSGVFGWDWVFLAALRSVAGGQNVGHWISAPLLRRGLIRVSVPHESSVGGMSTGIGSSGVAWMALVYASDVEAAQGSPLSRSATAPPTGELSFAGAGKHGVSERDGVSEGR